MKKLISIKKVLVTVLLVVSVAGALGSYYFYDKYQTLKNNPDKLTQEETQKLVDKVGQIVELPSDEQPSVAMVVDKEKLKDQQFFQSAENGDKVLVYATKAKKAILYRPSTGKVIEVSPIYYNEAKEAQESGAISE